MNKCLLSDEQQKSRLAMLEDFEKRFLFFYCLSFTITHVLIVAMQLVI